MSETQTPQSANKLVQLVGLLRSTARARQLDTVILFVTSRCNAYCDTCFYHAELNQPGDMTLAEIRRVSTTMPQITDLWLSGGEPMLRKDLTEIIDQFVLTNGVSRIIIPTNGLVKGRTIEVVRHTLATHPDITLYLNIALDGYGKTHDRIRGVPGNWEKSLDCIESLYELKATYGSRFLLNVNTVVCAENYTEMELLAEFLWSNYKLDGQYFNIIRGETKAGASIKEIPNAVLPGLYAHAAEMTERYGKRMFVADDASRRFVKTVAYLGAIMTHYRTQHENFSAGTAWPFPCTAGDTTAVIDYNGGLRACELREQFVSLKDYGFDFGAAWSSSERAAEVSAIDGGKACWCTHVCFIHNSMRHSRKAMIYGIPKNYLRRRQWKL